MNKLKLLFLAMIISLLGCNNPKLTPISTLTSDEIYTKGNAGYPATDIAINGYPIDSREEPIIKPTISSDPTFLIQQIPTPSSGLAILTGYVFSNKSNENLVDVPVMLAEIYRNEENDGAFVLDTGTSPFTSTDAQGRFVFTDIDPKEYVVVVGSIEVNQYEILAEPSGNAIIWEAIPNEILDAGEIIVEIEW